MKWKRQFDFLAPYVFLLLLAGLGYVIEFKVILIAGVALSIALGTTLVQKIYGALMMQMSSRGAERMFPGVFLSVSVILLIGAVILYFSSEDIISPGVLLGLAIYCLQSFILEKKAGNNRYLDK